MSLKARLFGKRDDFYERYDEDASFKMPIEDLFEGIKSGRIKRLSEKDYLQVEDFLERDEQGKTLLEYAYDYKLFLSDKLRKTILNDSRIIKECLKHKNSILLNKPNTIYILDPSVTDETLFEKYNEKESLIEFIIRNNMSSTFTLGRINDVRLFDVIRKYNKYDAIKYINENLLFSGYDRNTTFFEYFLKNNKIEPDTFKNINNPKVVGLCNKYNKLYLLKHAKSSILTYYISNGRTVLECLIKGNNADGITFSNLAPDKRDLAIDSIIRNRAYRYLVYFPKMLFQVSFNNSKKTYLDIMLENYNKSMDSYLADINLSNMTMNERALLYLKCADYDLNMFLPHITFESLVEEKNNVRFIDALLSIDRNKTIEKVIPKKLLQRSDVAAILKMSNIDIKDIEVPTGKSDEEKRIRNRYLRYKINPNVSKKLDTIRDMFLSDGTTDKDCVDTLVAAYTYLAHNNYTFLDRELDMIITYKRNNKNFYILKTDKKPYFNFNEDIIYLKSESVPAFCHELGHFIHKIGARRAKPNEMDRILFEIVNDPNTLKRVNQYASSFKKIEDRAYIEAQERYEKEYADYFKDHDLAKIRKLLDEDRENKIRRFIKLGYDTRLIYSVVNNLYNCSIKEFMQRFKTVKIEELKTKILYEKYSSLCALSDILDAIYKGRLSDGLLKTKDNQKIELPIGHGINYYNGEFSVFDEIMADYSQIIKDAEGSKLIGYLRYVAGDEFVDSLERFYINEVLDYQVDDFDMERGYSI